MFIYEEKNGLCQPFQLDHTYFSTSRYFKDKQIPEVVTKNKVITTKVRYNYSRESDPNLD